MVAPTCTAQCWWPMVLSCYNTEPLIIDLKKNSSVASWILSSVSKREKNWTSLRCNTWRNILGNQPLNIKNRHWKNWAAWCSSRNPKKRPSGTVRRWQWNALCLWAHCHCSVCKWLVLRSTHFTESSILMNQSWLTTSSYIIFSRLEDEQETSYQADTRKCSILIRSWILWAIGSAVNELTLEQLKRRHWCS